MNYYIQADSFFFPYEERLGGYLQVREGVFGDWVQELPEGAEVLDCSGYSVAPGLVDTHIHGFAGADVMDNSVEAIQTISQHLPETGVTSYLPTTLTGPSDLLNQVCQKVAAARGGAGAKIQGLYFEGPYFTEEYKGAQNPAYMGDPSLEEFNQWQTSAQGLITKIALAPERVGVTDFVEAVTKTGVVVALGHSNATLTQANSAVEAGASVWVHAFNGMRPLNHREPGMVGAVLNSAATYAELICDGHHVHQGAVKLLVDHKTADNVALITDCMRAGGMPEGGYTLGEFDVLVDKGRAVLKHAPDSLAGSILSLSQAVKNVYDWGVASREEAVRMATLVPALSCKIDDRCGQIKSGYSADFILLDAEFRHQATYIDGREIYSK